MIRYYTRLFGNPSSFAIDVDLHHPDGSNKKDYDYAHWGKFKFWVNGKNLTSATNSRGKSWSEIDWDISDLLGWLASNLECILTEGGMPVSESEKGSAFALCRFREADDFPDMELEIRQRVYEWWSRHAIRAGSYGGIFPNIMFRRRGNDMEISWAPEATFSDLTFPEAIGVAILPIDEVNDVLSSFLRETVDAILKERPEDLEMKATALRMSILPEEPEKEGG